MKKIVLDTNVIVASLRSRQGASYRLITLLGKAHFLPVVSIALVLEYEDVLKRPETLPHLTHHEIETFLNYICSVSQHQHIHFLWRPFLKDPKDDMLLELAIAAQSACIVTFNKRDFHGAEQFGVDIQTPYEFLRKLGNIA